MKNHHKFMVFPWLFRGLKVKSHSFYTGGRAFWELPKELQEDYAEATRSAALSWLKGDEQYSIYRFIVCIVISVSIYIYIYGIYVSMVWLVVTGT